MNTFLNLKIEGIDNRKIQLLNETPLNDRINNRGGREQFASILLTHYDPKFANRKSKNTQVKNNRFTCLWN